MVDGYDTLYLEGPNSLGYPFLTMGVKLVLCPDKRDHNSSVDVMYDHFVIKIEYRVMADTRNRIL
jgi:hypothetical protein